MSLNYPYVIDRFEEVKKSLQKAAQWGQQDVEVNAYLAGYMVVMICGVFEDCIEHLVVERAAKAGDSEVLSYVQTQIDQRFRNPDNPAILGVLGQFSDAYKQNYQNKVKPNSRPADAINSIVNNKNWLAHGETSKMQLTVSDVEDFFQQSETIFEALEQVLLEV